MKGVEQLFLPLQPGLHTSHGSNSTRPETYYAGRAGWRASSAAQRHGNMRSATVCTYSMWIGWGGRAQRDTCTCYGSTGGSSFVPNSLPNNILRFCIRLKDRSSPSCLVCTKSIKRVCTSIQVSFTIVNTNSANASFQGHSDLE